MAHGKWEELFFSVWGLLINGEALIVKFILWKGFSGMIEGLPLIQLQKSIQLFSPSNKDEKAGPHYGYQLPMPATTSLQKCVANKDRLIYTTQHKLPQKTQPTYTMPYQPPP